MVDRELTVEQIERLEGAESSCRHHWVIDTPSGPVSRGVCRICGQERVFRNYLEGSYWEDDVPLDQVSTSGRYPSSLGGAAEANPEDA